MTIHCLIVDDEQLARDMLGAYCQKISFLNITGKCKSAAEAAVFLKEKNIELIFLDINMPKQSGVDFLRQLKKPPKVIFTTAYSEYAIEGYELDVVDYLLKPIGFERFENAVLKAKELSETKTKAIAFDAAQSFENQHILVKEGYSQHIVFLKDIIHVKAMREYVVYHTSNGKLMELSPISSVEKLLPSEHFIRIHRSFLVAKSAVTGHEKKSLLLKDGTILPLGKTYKQWVLKELF